MKHVTIADPTCYDFLCSIIRLHNNGDFTPVTRPNQGIQEWVEANLNRTPDALRELAERFFNMETAFGLTLVGLINNSHSSTVPNFLRFLGEVDPEEIVSRFLYSGIGPGADASPCFVRELSSNKGLAFQFVQEKLSFSPREKWRVLEYLANPAQTKQQLLSLLDWHYHHIYKASEEQTRDFLQRANLELSDRLKRYGEDYLKLMVPLERGKPRDITMALSYYYEKSSLYNVLEDIYVFGYRYNERIEGQHAVLAGSQVFKALADETRLHIVKLLAERRWYGHELAQRLNISNSTVSHHISTLALNGLVRTYKEENRVYFELDIGEVKAVIGETIDRILLE